MGGIISLITGQYKLNRKTADVIIAPIDQAGKVDETLGGAKVLQFFPSSLSFPTSQNWTTKNVPGLSRPLYQWIGGEEFAISVTAEFSRDMDGEIHQEVTEDKYNVDINAAISWLRLLCSSDFQQVSDVLVAKAPPVVWLDFVGTNLSHGNGTPSNLAASSKSVGIHCLLKTVDPEITDWFASGTPKAATVTLGFVETIQYAGRINIPADRSALIALAAMYKRTPPK
jgi:hypothetical protein